jgi:hypothetical protein
VHQKEEGLQRLLEAALQLMLKLAQYCINSLQMQMKPQVKGQQQSKRQ